VKTPSFYLWGALSSILFGVGVDEGDGYLIGPGVWFALLALSELSSHRAGKK
jgi:hypothetical protein